MSEKSNGGITLLNIFLSLLFLIFAILYRGDISGILFLLSIYIPLLVIFNTLSNYSRNSSNNNSDKIKMKKEE